MQFKFWPAYLRFQNSLSILANFLVVSDAQPLTQNENLTLIVYKILSARIDKNRNLLEKLKTTNLEELEYFSENLKDLENLVNSSIHSHENFLLDSLFPVKSDESNNNDFSLEVDKNEEQISINDDAEENEREEDKGDEDSLQNQLLDKIRQSIKVVDQFHEELFG